MKKREKRELPKELTRLRCLVIIAFTMICTILLSSCGSPNNEDISGHYEGKTCYSEMDVVDLDAVPVPLTSSTMQSGAATNGGPMVSDLGGVGCYETSISGDMSLTLYENGSFIFNFFDNDPIEGVYSIEDDNVEFATDDGETSVAEFSKTLLKFNYVDGETVQYIFEKN